LKASTKSSGNSTISDNSSTTSRSGVGRLRIIAKASAPKRRAEQNPAKQRPAPARPDLEDISIYEIKNRIADSDWATLFTAEHKVTGMLVAAKFLNLQGPLASVAGTDDELVWRRRFALETEIMGAVSQPNVMPLLGHGAIPGGRLCLIMPFLETSLSDELGRDISDLRLLAHMTSAHRPKSMHLDRAFNVLRQTVSGVGALHRLGIAHGNLNSDTVMMTHAQGGDPVLCDFMMAKWGDSSPEIDVQAFNPTAYTSPEQVADPARVDPSSDVYALGALAYRMLTARVPGRGEKSVQKAGVDVSTGVDRFIQECLSTKPERRPAHAPAMQVALDKAILG
jgi:eukaryotic-like serine/threonine-protein kinase